MPKFQNMTVWQQAEALMQPAFIRVIANITKQLEQSAWKGEYEDIQVWPEGTSEAMKTRVRLLRSQLETAPPDQIDTVTQALAQLPTPYPGYQLRLTLGNHQITVDVWDLCYQVCFQDYDSASGTSHLIGKSVSEGVEIDSTLFDETGDVDWHRLDNKAYELVERVFVNLPIQQ